MPEADSTRKRSRSPSDSEEQKYHKRPNTGAAPSNDDGDAPSGLLRLFRDVAVTDSAQALASLKMAAMTRTAGPLLQQMRRRPQDQRHLPQTSICAA